MVGCLFVVSLPGVKKRVMPKVAFKGIPYPCMAMLPVSPSPYAILCIEQVSIIVKKIRMGHETREFAAIIILITHNHIIL